MAVDWDRRVIPRWRYSGSSSSTPESSALSKGTFDRKSINNKSILENRIKAWQSQKDLGGAVDLINFSHISDFKQLLIEPATFILSEGGELPRQLKFLAQTISDPSALTSFVNSEIESPQDSFRKQVSELKKSLIIDPRNSIGLIDIARVYAAQGQNKKAKESIVKAVSLQPNHRFILRASARFLIHNDQSEEALNLLNKTSATVSDPWLMATHISLETILGRTPKFIKKADLIVDSGRFSPIHLSELGGSIATFQAFNGDIKKAKRQFAKALISPNDNVVAQAVWATEKFGLQIEMKEEWLANPFSHEARYYQYILNADFDLAIGEARDWFIDEPYAVRPMRAATYICCVLGHYDLAEKYALQALEIDKFDIELNNNLVFALAAQNRISEATEKLSEVVKLEKSITGTNGGHVLANWGMIQFRLGNYEEGEKYYRLAMEEFESKKNYSSRAQAAAYMARESMLSQNPKSPALLTEVLDIIKKYPSKTALKILEISKLIEKSPIQPVQEKTVNWVYDAERKLLILNK